MKRNVRKFRLVLTTLTLVALALSVFGAVPTQAIATEVWVDDSYSAVYCPAGTTYGTTCFETIGTALAGVADGGTIYVGSGTYDEALNITKNVTLIGYGGPVITGGADPAVNDIIKVDGAYTVNIRGFTIDRVTASTAVPNTGIYYLNGASGTIEGNTIRHIEGVRGYGIVLGGRHDTDCSTNLTIGVDTVTVRNNTTGGITAATAIGRSGIEVKCPTSGAVVIEDNECIGNNGVFAQLSYGIAASGGADPIIRNNNIHDHVHPVEIWGSAGIMCTDYQATAGNGSDATIENNYIHDNATGIFVGSRYYPGTHDFSSPTISYNLIENHTSYGIAINGGANPTITNNTIIIVVADPAIDEGNGIHIYDTKTTSTGGGASTVAYNTISGCDSAIWVSASGSGGATYTFTSNNLANNTVGFTNDYDFTTDINAENNWWGATSGPAVGYIVGTVPGDVDYDPWSEALMGGVAASTHAVGETSSFDVKVTADQLWAYQFIVDYDTAPVDVTDLDFDNTTFDTTTNASIPPGWNKDLDDVLGTVHFGVSKMDPATPINLANNRVAYVTFECEFQGTSTIAFDQAKLSDIDGYEIPSTWVGDSVVCTAAERTAIGQMELQSRYSGHYDGTVVTFVPGDYTDTSIGDGAFSITVPDGIGYTVSFEMPRFLDYVVTGLTISADYNFGTIRLRGGDTNDDDIINIQDLSNIGGVFGTSPGTGDDADINYDGDVNILDLAVAGGNFGKTSPVLW